MIIIRYCDWSKKPINSDETFEIKLVNGVDTVSFELSKESYEHLLELLTGKAQPIVNEPTPLERRQAQITAEGPPPPAELSPQAATAERVIAESRVADTASLPALSDPSKKRETLQKLEEFNKKHSTNFKNKNGGNGINFQDLTESDITNKFRGK